MKALCLLPLLALCMLTACENGDAENTYDITTDTTAYSKPNDQAAKLVKKAGVNIKVRNAQESVRNVSVLVRSMGGMITHQQIDAAETDIKELRLSNDSVLQRTAYTTTADITARVPSHHLEDFLQDVHALGYFTSNSQLSIDDKSLHYMVQQRQQQNRSTFLKTAPSKPSKPSTPIVSLQVNDEIIEQEREMRQIDLDVAYSTVQLHLMQHPMVRKEVKANADLASYQLPFTTQLAQSFQSGWNLFLQFIIAVTNLWMFIVAGVAFWYLVKLWNRKKQPVLR